MKFIIIKPCLQDKTGLFYRRKYALLFIIIHKSSVIFKIKIIISIFARALNNVILFTVAAN